jgi:CheY-like chemotaxis protein
MTMPRSTPRLLVIDDSLTIRKLVELSFRSTAFNLDFATNGSEGAALAAERRPDVILLDCVLPDMKAAEVCHRLAQHPASAGIPIILMSAKDQGAVRETLRDPGRVVDFVGKPFTTEEIVARVQAVLASAPQPARDEAHESARFSFKLTETAAKTLYARLAQPLGNLPEWLRQAQAQGRPNAVTAHVARKLLTPEIVTGILEALLPIYRQALGDEPSDPEGPAFTGQMAGWPLLDLLAVVGRSAKTGELVLTHGQHRVITFWEGGELVLCSGADPIDYCQDSPVALGQVPAELRARAEAEQRESGTPVYVTVAEAGQLPPEVDLPALLQERGLRLLRNAHQAPSLRYAWRELAALPSFVHSWGRHLPLQGDAFAREGASQEAQPEPPSIAQLNLERLRRPSAWSEVDPRLPQPDQAYQRAYAFSSKLRALRLTASEQRVLTLVDRRHPVATITTRVGLSAREVARIVYRLAEIDLIQPVPSGPPSVVSEVSVNVDPTPRPVMIVDGDVAGFCAPLRELLAGRPRPIALIDATAETDLLEAVMRERPALLMVSESAAPDQLEAIARILRGAPGLAGLALAAVLESSAPQAVDTLSAAGFDAVWVKPIHSRDLLALVSADSAFAAAPPLQQPADPLAQPHLLSSAHPEPPPPAAPAPPPRTLAPAPP